MNRSLLIVSLTTILLPACGGTSAAIQASQSVSSPDWITLAISSIFTILAVVVAHWLNNRAQNSESVKSKKELLESLNQELRHAKWCVSYNYGRATDAGLGMKALTPLSTVAIERCLFGESAPLADQLTIIGQLHDYLGQVTYLNSLLCEYNAIFLNPGVRASNWINTGLNEIIAICTPDSNYRQADTEPSLSSRIDTLLQALESIHETRHRRLLAWRVSRR